jgi:hypothetical protein
MLDLSFVESDPKQAFGARAIIRMAAGHAV